MFCGLKYLQYPKLKFLIWNPLPFYLKFSREINFAGSAHNLKTIEYKKGKSLLTLLNGKRSCKNPLVFSRIAERGAYAILSSDYKLIVCQQGFIGFGKMVHECAKCFIDLKEKKETCKKIAGKNERMLYKDLLKKLRTWLYAEHKKCQNLKMEPAILSEEEKENLRALGYLQ